MKRLFLLVFFNTLLSYCQSPTIAGTPLDTLHFKKYRNLISDADRFIKSSPDNPEHYFKRAGYYIELRDYNAALADINKSIELTKGENAAPFYKRGSIYERMEQYDKAIQDFTFVIEKMPNWEWGYNDRAMVYTSMKKFDLAEKDFKKAIELKPDWSVVYVNMGVMYNDMGQPEKAITFYEKALTLNKFDSMVYNNLGVIYREKREYQKAIAYFDQAIQYYPKYFNAYRNRADAKNFSGDTEGACQDLKTAAALGDEKSAEILTVKCK